jgi:hypothetical protein
MFRSIRSQLPSYENLLRPCTIIDNPAISRNTIFEHSAYFTHDGAEFIYENLAYDIDQYTKRYAEIADPLWEKYFNSKKGIE